MVVSLKTKMIIYKHEHSHLFECSIRALLLKSNDIVLLSKEGMMVLNLGSEDRRAITDSKEVGYMLYSLKYC